MYQMSWELFLEKPLFGHGIGSYTRVFQEKRISFQRENPVAYLSPRMNSHPHNEVLFWLVENGLIAVSGMVAFIAVTVLQLFSLGWQRGLAYAALIFPISLHVLVELPFYLSPIHWFTWLIFLFLIHSKSKVVHKNQISQAARRLIAVLTIMIALALFAFFLHTLYSINNLIRYVDSGGRDVAKLEAAVRNPALMDTGETLLMRNLLYHDIRTAEKSNVALFIDWAEKYIKHSPDPRVFADLSLAYAYRGSDDKARKIINHAVLIYKNNSMLLDRKKHISDGNVIDDFRARFGGTKIETKAHD
jgi:O-antigen polymerase